MLRRIGVERKIVILIVTLLLVTSAVIILINRAAFQRIMRNQLETYQLPLVSDSALSAVVSKIFTVTDALKLLKDNPTAVQYRACANPGTYIN